jgi:hypothetical protein
MQTRQLTKTIRSLIAAGKVRVLKHASERMALRAIDGRQTRVIVTIVDDLLVITVVGPLK